MATIRLPLDFKEFIQCINSAGVEYLLVGGYAVGFHGAPRFTGDMDIWVADSAANTTKLGEALLQFGFRDPQVVSGEVFKKDAVFRMGRPPLQIDLLRKVSGCDFSECYSRRDHVVVDEVQISIISLEDLKANKRAAGRAKDLGDFESLS